MRLIPMTYFWYFAFDNKIKIQRRIFGGIFSTGILFWEFFLLHFSYQGYVNFLHTAKSVIRLEISYSYGEYFAISMMVLFITAFLLSKILRRGRKVDSIERNAGYLLSAAIGTFVLSGIAFSEIEKEQLVINEVCTNNRNVYIMESDAYCDYVELYNKGKFICHIKDLYLSDDETDLKKMKIQETRLYPGEHLVIGLEKEKVGFSLDRKGEEVYLSDTYGNIWDQVSTGEQSEDSSLTRLEDEWVLRTCTPGKMNQESQDLVQIEKPSFSHDGGFYDEEFILTLKSTKGHKIYYTLDGSIPDENSLEYKEAIRVYDRSKEENKWNSIQNVVEDWKNYQPDKTKVDKAFIVRAIAMDEEGNFSDAVTASYFVDMAKYENEIVVSLIADPEELFGDTGIHVTGKEYDDWYLANGTKGTPIAYFKKTGREVEIGASMEVYFSKNKVETREIYHAFSGEESFSQNVGIRIQGAGTRKEPKKRFSVYARKEYSGSKWFDTTFIEDRKVHSIVLRDGFANSVIPYMVKDRAVISQEAFPAVVFLNGEYWYHTYVQEKFSEAFFEEKYGIEKDNVIIVKNSMAETWEEDAIYQQVYQYVEEHDLSDSEAFEEFCQMIDLQSYIDFTCINAYLANVDYDLYKNYIMWRTQKVYDDEYQDGRWRWLIFDMDDVAYQEINEDTRENDWVKIDSFSRQGGGASSPLAESILFKALRKNEQFCRQFVTTFMDLANENFSIKSVEKVLKQWEEDITWNDSFFLKRAQYIVPYMAEEFTLSGTLEKVEINVNDAEAGRIYLNTITPTMENGTWSGQYYTDYPINVMAEAKPGYRFVEWRGSVDSKEAALEIAVKEGGIKLYAVFEKTE